MAETVPGGVYKVGDEFQNANGEKVPAPKTPPTQPDPDAGATAGTQGGPGLTGGGGKEGGDAGAGGFDLDNATKAEMMAEAERRGITVERADGEPGVPLVEDYKRALARG